MPEATDLVERFTAVDTSDLPDFYRYKKPLEMGLWVLWVAKEKLGIRRLGADEIAQIIRDVKEIGITAKSIALAFNRGKGKINRQSEGGGLLYEIMKPGKDHLVSAVKRGLLEVVHFEPGKRFTSKRVLSKNLLGSLKGELRIVDPYCGIRTLDVLREVGDRPVRLLTRTAHLNQTKRERFQREVRDFCAEHPAFELRDYPGDDLHDRYVISSRSVVILGHSIKDLGNRESFAVLLDAESSKDLLEALRESFNRRWKRSNPIR